MPMPCKCLTASLMQDHVVFIKAIACCLIFHATLHSTVKSIHWRNKKQFFGGGRRVLSKHGVIVKRSYKIFPRAILFRGGKSILLSVRLQINLDIQEDTAIDLNLSRRRAFSATRPFCSYFFLYGFIIS